MTRVPDAAYGILHAAARDAGTAEGVMAGSSPRMTS